MNLSNLEQLRLMKLLKKCLMRLLLYVERWLPTNAQLPLSEPLCLGYSAGFQSAGWGKENWSCFKD